MEWIRDHAEYERLHQLRLQERKVMDALSRQAVRCFDLYGGTIETRDHPAYRRYLEAWKKRSRSITAIHRQMMDRLEGAYVRDKDELTKLELILMARGIRCQMMTQHEVARRADAQVLAFDDKRVLVMLPA